MAWTNIQTLTGTLKHGIAAGKRSRAPVWSARPRASIIDARALGSPIGGLKIATASGWFAAGPSGTENLYKIYAESLNSERHLEALVAEAQRIVSDALGGFRRETA